MPLPIRALSIAGSASKSFTFEILLSIKRLTTVEGFNLCEDSVPQFTPMADSAIGRNKREKTRVNVGWNIGRFVAVVGLCLKMKQLTSDQVSLSGMIE